MRKGKAVTAKNIKTGEVLEFPSQYSLEKYFSDLYFIESSSKNIGRLTKQKRPYRGIWRVTFKEA